MGPTKALNCKTKNSRELRENQHVPNTYGGHREETALFSGVSQESKEEGKKNGVVRRRRFQRTLVHTSAGVHSLRDAPQCPPSNCPEPQSPGPPYAKSPAPGHNALPSVPT